MDDFYDLDNGSWIIDHGSPNSKTRFGTLFSGHHILELLEIAVFLFRSYTPEDMSFGNELHTFDNTVTKKNI